MINELLKMLYECSFTNNQVFTLLVTFENGFEQQVPTILREYSDISYSVNT